MTQIGARFPQWYHSKLRLYLYQLRKEQGLSMEELAKSAGYGTKTVNAWEHGYSAPGIIELMTWCEALGYQLCAVPIGVKRDKHKYQEIEMQLKLEGTK